MTNLPARTTRAIVMASMIALTVFTFDLAAYVQANAAEPQTSEASMRAQLIGSWRLISRESKRADGTLEPDAGLASVPMGILIYDQSGHVAAQLSRRDRTVAMLGEECEAAKAVKGRPDTAQTILGYDAYFGTYTLNAHDHIVTHHLDAALFPGDIGKSIQRRFAISGDRLTISFDTTTQQGVKVTRILIWERMK